MWTQMFQFQISQVFLVFLIIERYLDRFFMRPVYSVNSDNLVQYHLIFESGDKTSYSKNGSELYSRENVIL